MGFFQARVLEWGASAFSWVAFHYPEDLPNPGTEPRSLAMQADSLPAGPPGKPYSYYEKYKSLSRVQLFATPSTVQSMEFSKSEYCSG